MRGRPMKPMKRRAHQLLRRKASPLLGVIAGIFIATLFSVWAVAVYLVSGGGAFERLGISFGATISIYFAGGIVGGLVVGLIWPLTRWWWGAAVVGVVGALPVYLMASVALDGDFLGGTILAIVVGGIVGLRSWSPPPISHSRGSEGSNEPVD